MKFFVNVTLEMDAEDMTAAMWQAGNLLTKAQANFDATGVEDWIVENAYAPGEDN